MIAMFLTPDPSARLPAHPPLVDHEPWSDDVSSASLVFAELVRRYREAARLGRDLRALRPDHEELGTLREILLYDRARIRARLASYKPPDRQRRNPH